MPQTSEQVEQRLSSERNIWLATMRPNGAPHLIPIWFVSHEGRLFICTDPKSVKVRNLERNPSVALALENGTSPVILEGTARVLPSAEAPAEVISLFKFKYDWAILESEQYAVVLEVTPAKQLSW